ncbi:MAG TPA: restriction endonuclease subunit S [Gammaproteobacteria bacterium]|nr:restriction endonuclease subunit S [Gammaproteobacteria bacterium]
MNTINVVPDNWVVMPLGEACKTVKGKKPKESGSATAKRSVPYINIKAFESGQPAEFAQPGNYPKCEQGDVLIVWDGARAGLSGRAVPGYIGSTLAKIYSDKADNGYLFYFLQSQYGRVNGRTKGVGIPHVDPMIFNNIPFPIAPPDQQKRIVAEIEKQFSRLDEAVANLKRVKANLKRYKAAVLKAAVEGRLVETEASIARREVRSYETGEQLLQRILESRRSQWKGKGKYKEPILPDTTNLFELPEGWVWASVGQISGLVEYGSSAKTRKDTTGVPVLRMGNIVDGELVFVELKYLPSGHDEFPKLLLQPGDLLFNRTNSPELVGKTAVFAGSPMTCSFASYLIRVRLVEGGAPKFLASYINSLHGRNWVKSVVTQQVGQANVNGTKLQALAVPLPPELEQQRIVMEIDRRLTLIRETESQIDVSLQRCERERQSILERSFSGRIVYFRANAASAANNQLLVTL